MGTTALLLFVCMSAVIRGGAASIRQLQATRGGVSSDTAVDPEVYMDSVCNAHPQLIGQNTAAQISNGHWKH